MLEGSDSTNLPSFKWRLSSQKKVASSTVKSPRAKHAFSTTGNLKIHPCIAMDEWLRVFVQI